MIIDIYGMPGSGKSYYSKTLIKEKQNKFFNLIELERYTLLGKVIRRVISFFVLILIKLKLVTKIIDPSLKYHSAKYNVGRHIDFYETRIWMLILIYNNIPKKINLVVDEGIWHVVATLIVEYGISDAHAKKIISMIQKKLKTNVEIESVYQYISVDLAKESIRKRDRKVAAIDFLSGDNLTIFLNKYLDACDLIFSLNHNHKLKIRK